MQEPIAAVPRSNQHLPLVLMLSLVLASPLALHAEGAEMEFRIEPQSLDKALIAYSVTTGVQIVADGALTDAHLSKGVSGRYSLTQALERLLAGTGLKASPAGKGMLRLEKSEVDRKSAPAPDSTALPTVKVTARAGSDVTDPYNPNYRLPNSSTATKTDTPIMDTPFSVQVLSKQLLQDRQAVTIDKALENVSGVVQGGFNQRTSDGFMMRGFQTTNYYRDGVLMPISFALATTKRETANLESIEVLKGPGSLLYGRAEPGGVINITTKKPLSTPYYSAQQQFGSYDFYRTTIDATGPLGTEESLLYRANLSYENAGSFRDFVDSEKLFFAPVLTWKIGPRTQATVELEYQHFHTGQDIGVPPIGNRPAHVSNHINVVEPFNNNWNGDSVLAGFNWSHEFNDDWKVVNRFMTQNIDIANAYTSFVAFKPVLSDGVLDVKTVGFPRQRNENYFTTLNVIGKVDVGEARNELLFGFDYYNLRNMALINVGTPFWRTNLFKPVYRNAPVALNTADEFAFSQRQSWYGLYFQDQITLPFDIHVMGGVRYDNAMLHDNVSGTNFPSESRVNPRGGVLWKPASWLSVYGSYTENFGVSNSSFNAEGYTLPPQTAQQWEAGLKAEMLDGKLRSTLSYFDLKQQNLPSAIPGTFFYRALGGAETRGLEFDTTGELLPGWNLIAAYTYMPFARITRDTDGGGGIGNQGNRLFGVPTHSGSLWNTYEFQQGNFQGLKFGAGVVAAGQRQGNPENTYQLPGYAALNLMASYQVNVGGSRVTTQLNADNVLGKNYFVGTNSANQIQFGTPLTVMGSIRVDY